MLRLVVLRKSNAELSGVLLNVTVPNYYQNLIIISNNNLIAK
jgi:hypothetical protein